MELTKDDLKELNEKGKVEVRRVCGVKEYWECIEVKEE